MAASKRLCEPSTSSDFPQRRRSVTNSCRGCGRPMLKQEVVSANSSLRFTANELSLLCEACKKFYCRYRGKFKGVKCCCGGSKNPGDICRLCRYQRCESAMLGRKTPDFAAHRILHRQNTSQAEKVDFSKIPCAVCGFSSSGFHFGVVSCEGCKGFFRRSVNRTYKNKYTCKAVKDGRELPPGELCPQSSNCRKCRLQRCINAGMSLGEIAIGRHTVRRRAQIDAALKKHSAEGSFLKQKTCRRNKTAVDERAESPKNEKSESTFSPQPPSVRPGPVTRSLTASSFGSPSGYEADEADTRPEKTPDSTSAPAFSDSNPNNTKPSPSAIALAKGYAEHADNTVDECLKQSCDWYIERAVEAAARLATISNVRVILNQESTEQDFVSARISSLETYVKCVSEFATALPGFNRIALNDRIQLFAQDFFPIAAAQLSLHFDVERQVPNSFSLEGPAWEFSAKTRPRIHFAIDNFMREAGNRFSPTVGTLQQFSLFCALLLLNPETPNLENVEAVRAVRNRYDLALWHLLSNTAGIRSEQQLGKIYLLLPFFRRATALFQDVFVEINTRLPDSKRFWTPLFCQLEAQVNSLSSPAPSSTATSPQ